MASATLSIDLGAVARNWQALDAQCAGETGAAVMADGYGLGAAEVCGALLRAGARSFFVATAEEGAAARAAMGPGPAIYVSSGHMPGDAAAIRESALTPLLNSADQMLRHVEALPEAPFGVQLDTGMNRLGMEPAEWSAVRDIAMARGPAMLASHLACADEPGHPMNARQLAAFRAMTDGLDAPRSLAATGGILLGPEYHFDVARPGIGLYGGLPFVDAVPVVALELPVIQVRDVARGESVGHGGAWVAPRDARVATASGGHADGLLRSMGPGATLFAGGAPCPVVGRVSMDLVTADVTGAGGDPDELQLMGLHQSADSVAAAAGTTSREILPLLGRRFRRSLAR